MRFVAYLITVGTVSWLAVIHSPVTEDPHRLITWALLMGFAGLGAGFVAKGFADTFYPKE